MTLQSYKPYSRIVTILSGLIIVIASLDATQVISLFPEYASQINTILVVAGLMAPAISQELRVVRAEDLIKQDYEENNQKEEDLHITLNLDGDIITDDMDEAEDNIDESDVA